MTNSRNDGADKAQNVNPPIHASPTLVGELRFLVEGHRSWNNLAELVDVAKCIEARCQTGHNGSDAVRGHRRLLFKAEIEEAERFLTYRGWHCDGYEDLESDCLAKAIACYLDLPPAKSWSVDSLIEAIGRLER